MALKQEVLRILEEMRGKSISGEEMAVRLSVSRNAVWKAIKSLQADGVEIEAGTNRGYCLSENSDYLTEEGIMRYLHVPNIPVAVTVYEKVSSTNTVLKEAAEQGGAEGMVAIAREQTSGKGRRGRTFYSPRSGSLYMSILLRPDFPMEQALLITTAAAVSVARAVEETSGKETAIKWVNDVFIANKKICGILTEAAVDMETGYPAYAVLGIGINIYPPKDGIPEELSDIVGTVFHTPGEGGGSYGDRLAAKVIEHFFTYYKALPDVGFMEEYRKRSFLIGRQVTYLSGGSEKKVKVVGVDDAAGLVVETETGDRLTLDSGEVSVKF